MTNHELYTTLKERFCVLLDEHGLAAERVTITARGLTPEEAIGDPERRDYPILVGEEVMLMASFLDGRGQAFTDAPAQFSGTLQDLLAADVEHDPHARALFVASLNAVMDHLGISSSAVHCRNDGPEQCAVRAADWVAEHYGCPKVAMVGYQPAMAAALSRRSPLRVLDLNPKNIGAKREGFVVLDGAVDREETVEWAELVLCTGSTICNGTLVDFLELDKPTVFFGTTLSGAAPLLGLPRLCFADQV